MRRNAFITAAERRISASLCNPYPFALSRKRCETMVCSSPFACLPPLPLPCPLPPPPLETSQNRNWLLTKAMVPKLPLALTHSAPGDARPLLRVLYSIICVMLYYGLTSRQRRICGDRIAAIAIVASLGANSRGRSDSAEMIDSMCVSISTRYANVAQFFYFILITILAKYLEICLFSAEDIGTPTYERLLIKNKKFPSLS